ncbi:MAG: heme o synthase [Saprospiraceae bacterium]
MKQSNNQNTTLAAARYAISSVLLDYGLLIKIRLTSVVVLSSALGYLIAAGSSANLRSFILIILGGFFVTSAANALNQVFEKDFDSLMLRTSNRPLAAGRMRTAEAVLFAGLSCLAGILILATFNPITAILGMVSLVLYAFVYTPMKRYSTMAVAIGAIPGALPVLIGFTAHEGTISAFGMGLFVLQFLWQFPHFWSIGYVSFDDYQRAGFKLLPVVNDQIDRNLGLSSMFYSVLTIPVIGLLFLYGLVHIYSAIFCIVLSVIYIFLAFEFHRKFDRKSALMLMFYSFVYLPLLLLTILLLG